MWACIFQQKENKFDQLNVDDNYFESSDGAVRIWIEQGTSIQMKVSTQTNDSVELSAEEALEIVDVLRQFASRI